MDIKVYLRQMDINICLRQIFHEKYHFINFCLNTINKHSVTLINETVPKRDQQVAAEQGRP